ncbi:MAG: bifunctional 2-polyprenyl-6-hydroxyphenol methylase/3-demethylubiquinol 3-O-methyltransferase UbiG [Dongiaceae bacterium]
MTKRKSKDWVHSSIDGEEIGRFQAIAGDWWKEEGKFRPLHLMNPVRLDYITETLRRHFGGIKGLRILDIGCGGGLMAEPLTRLGADVTGIDAEKDTIAIAKNHAKKSGLEINYRAATAETLQQEGLEFDAVLALEIIEHVNKPAAFIKTLAQLIKPGGMVILSTLNRTLKSFALSIIAAEYVLGWLPKGTHDWQKFITPEELTALLKKSKLKAWPAQGIAFNPIGGHFYLSKDCGVNYLLAAKK